MMQQDHPAVQRIVIRSLQSAILSVTRRFSWRTLLYRDLKILLDWMEKGSVLAVASLCSLVCEGVSILRVFQKLGTAYHARFGGRARGPLEGNVVVCGSSWIICLSAPVRGAFEAAIRHSPGLTALPAPAGTGKNDRPVPWLG